MCVYTLGFVTRVYSFVMFCSNLVSHGKNELLCENKISDELMPMLTHRDIFTAFTVGLNAYTVIGSLCFV